MNFLPMRIWQDAMARVTHGPKTRLIKHSCTPPFIVFIAQNLFSVYSILLSQQNFEGEQGCCDTKHLDSPCYFKGKFVLEVLKNYP